MRFTNYSPIPASFTLFITFILLLITSTQAASTARGEATFFNPGLGACGYVHGDGDMVVALSWQRFGGKNPCGRRIKVRRGNRVAWATVVDKCMGCKKNDVDLSPAAFRLIGAEPEGRFQVIWRFD